MLKGVRSIGIIAVGFVLVTSCSKFKKIQKSDDWEVKHKAALEYYENEDYYRASVLFEEILPIMRGRPEAELVQFYFAYSHFFQKQYLLAAHYFDTFFKTYSRSEYAEEAMFMHAYSLYLDSPDYNLDQTNTVEAINAIQSFLNRYPRSEYAEQANDIINALQIKLEEKAYENAYHYYKLEKYNGGEALKAALIAFENFQKDFPDSEWNEEISYYMVEASYKLAKKSIRSKKMERLQKVIEYYEYFIDNFPDSNLVRSAENTYDNCLDDIEKLETENL
jgi:outer membrane protein assembly factor BamD